MARRRTWLGNTPLASGPSPSTSAASLPSAIAQPYLPAPSAPVPSSPRQGAILWPMPERSEGATSPSVVFLCTGNAARSVIAGVALAQHLPSAVIATAGTFVVEGQPISFRTRAALAAVGLPAPDHRSRQAVEHELGRADVIVALAPEH